MKLLSAPDKSRYMFYFKAEEPKPELKKIREIDRKIVQEIIKSLMKNLENFDG